MGQILVSLGAEGIGVVEDRGDSSLLGKSRNRFERELEKVSDRGPPATRDRSKRDAVIRADHLWREQESRDVSRVMSRANLERRIERANDPLIHDCVLSDSPSPKQVRVERNVISANKGLLKVSVTPVLW